jgi:hypothetical protein
MDIFFKALDDAAGVWEHAITQLNWHSGIVVLAYVGAAWLCLVNAHISRQNQQAHVFWYLGAATLCLLGVNTVLQADLFVTHLLRAIAKLQGWYAQRRELQYGAVLLLGIIFLLSINWLRALLSNTELPSELVAVGLTGLLMLFLTRMVSAHNTDLVLNLRLAGVSVGRLLEFAAIGLVIQGARNCLRVH